MQIEYTLTIKLCPIFENLELIASSLIFGQSSEGITVQATNEQSGLQDHGCGCFLFKKVSNK